MNNVTNKERLTSIFMDTQQYISKSDELQKYIDESIKNTITGDYFPLPKDIRKSGNIMVTNGRTLEVAKQYANGRTAVLNFASATNPGGMCMKGSSAQEESLCRISTLYNTLDTQHNHTVYYNFHKKYRSKLYSNILIYSPNVCVFKQDEMFPYTILDRDEWYFVDVITSAAPNLIHFNISALELEKLLFDRISTILTAAAAHNVDNIILGAFGCGVFKNPPSIVAKVFRDVLNSGLRYYFENVVFAIIDDHRGKGNFKIFERELSDL